jgi:phytoene synthase
VDKENSARPATGSDVYYALLYGSQAHYEQLATICALKATLCTIPMSVSDAGVARVKLEWWRLEAERLTTGEPRHFLTRAYYDKYGADVVLGNALNALVCGLDSELGGRHFATRDEQIVWFDASFGPLYGLQTSILARTNRDMAEDWQALGRWIEIGYSLLNLKLLATYKLKRIPTEALVAAGCTWDDIDSARPSAVVANLVATECNLTIDSIADILVTTPKETRRIHQALFALAAIIQHTLIELKEDGCQIWQHRIELTALRKLWLAWRMRYL